MPLAVVGAGLGRTGTNSLQLALTRLLGAACYQSSKGALHAAMYYLAKELGPHKIRVNTVVPTWMWGPPVEGYVEMTARDQGIPKEQVIAGITQNMPLGEIPTDGDVAEVVVFFASDRARMVTMQSVMVNAGEFPH